MFSASPDTSPRSAAELAQGQQRAISERLLIGALRAQDAVLRAVDAETRANFLVSAGRELAMALEPGAIRDIILRSALPRAGSWCIADIIEADGSVTRLVAEHPDRSKQALAHSLEHSWQPVTPRERFGGRRDTLSTWREPRVITLRSGGALIAAARGAHNVEILRAIGFGELLVIPLVVRNAAVGAITFVTRDGDAPLSKEEIALAASLADRCAIALDNARLYAEANQLRAAADVANRAKSVFLGNMTHELLTPLNAIGGYVELLEMGLRGPVTREQEADLERIKHSQVHLVTLIRRILEYVRSEGGSVAYRPTPVDVRPLLRDAADMVAPTAAEKQLTIQVRTPSRPVVVLADAMRVRQILVNLVTNAVKYSPAGSGDIVLSCAAEPDAAHIRVADEGSGIPTEQMTAIFEPFFQLESGLSERRGGVGLGLAISRDLAIGMKGDVTVQSTVGVGSQFTLTLPRGERRRTPR